MIRAAILLGLAAFALSGCGGGAPFEPGIILSGSGPARVGVKQTF